MNSIVSLSLTDTNCFIKFWYKMRNKDMNS